MLFPCFYVYSLSFIIINLLIHTGVDGGGCLTIASVTCGSGTYCDDVQAILQCNIGPPSDCSAYDAVFTDAAASSCPNDLTNVCQCIPNFPSCDSSPTQVCTGGGGGGGSTSAPSLVPSRAPSRSPSKSPHKPSHAPSRAPRKPTSSPTLRPTQDPTPPTTKQPTKLPTNNVPQSTPSPSYDTSSSCPDFEKNHEDCLAKGPSWIHVGCTGCNDCNNKNNCLSVSGNTWDTDTCGCHVKDDKESCFPGDALVQLGNGERLPMSKLTVGDIVRVGPRNEDLDTVVWVVIHRDDETGLRDNLMNQFPYLVLSTIVHHTQLPGPTLILSHNHMVVLFGDRLNYNSTERLVPADKVKIGDVMMSGSGDYLTIHDIHVEYRIGKYGPMTFGGKLIVNDVIASMYTTDTMHLKPLAEKVRPVFEKLFHLLSRKLMVTIFTIMNEGYLLFMIRIPLQIMAKYQSLF
jgi:hypothetical protein